MKTVCIANDPAIDKFLEPLKEIGQLEIFHKKNLLPKEVIEYTKNADILITGPEAVGRLSKEILSKLSSLKFISLLTIGTDWVDLEYTKEKGIEVSNIAGSTAESVAEHAWAMILDLSKRVSEFDRASRLEGNYNFANFKGKEILGKTLGVLGLGNVGKRVAEIGETFTRDILGVHTSMKTVGNVKVVDKGTLIKESDVIVVCLPLTNDTKDYISEKEIESMKQGVIIVNPAREKIVNKEAVLKGVKDGKIFGYGVETTIMKEIPEDDPYYTFPNVIVTPHNAFNTIEADQRSYELVVENILRYAKGTPQNLVG